MKNVSYFLGIFLLFYAATGFAQMSNQYTLLAKEGDSLYQAKAYLKSAETFGKAFAANEDKGTMNDRYNAACAWSLAGQKDSSFYHLFRLARKGGYSNLNHLTTDTDLDILHDDTRWKELYDTVKRIKMPKRSILKNHWWPFWIPFIKKTKNTVCKLTVLKKNMVGIRHK
jgi:hypothetical protein